MPIERTFEAILFDNDGTCVDSTPGVVVAMTAWCERNGLDAEVFLRSSHGLRTSDFIRDFQTYPVPGSSLTPAELTLAVDAHEMGVLQICQQLSDQGKDGIIALPGVHKLFKDLKAGGARYGIVTSATRAYATQALPTAGISVAVEDLPFLVSGEDVINGKPAPDPFLAGIEALKKIPGPSINPANVLVVEDAPAGLESGNAAGCQTLAVCTSQSQERILACEAMYRVVDLTRIEVVCCGPEGITLSIRTLEEELAKA